MRSPVSVTVDSATSSKWVPLDYRQAPFSVGLGVVLSAGASLTYSVEHTFQDIQDPDVTPIAFENSGLQAKTANDDGNYAFPVKAVRLTITSYTSGNATLYISQGVR